MSDFVGWETYLQAPKAMQPKHFLYDLNLRHGTNLEILDHDKSFLNETIRFKFSGERHKVEALREEYKQIVLEVIEKQHKNKFYTERCKVDEITVTYGVSNLNIDIISSKSEKIHRMALDIKNHFGIDYTLTQKDNGFLRGKTVSIEVNGSHEDRQLFVNTMIDYIDCKKPAIVQSAKDSQLKENATNNFVACYVLSANIEYAPKNVTIDVYTRDDKQNTAVVALAESIKNQFGIDYKLMPTLDGVKIEVNDHNEKVQLFADTMNQYMDWKVEPTIINDARVTKSRKP